MKAIIIGDFGGLDQIELADIPVPEPGRGEILIRIKAAALNPVDWKIRNGLLKTRLPHLFPITLGWDAAGVVARCGVGASKFRTGDAVYAYCRKPIVHGGTYAEYITVSESSAAKKPRHLSFEEAAAIPLAGLTAYQCLFTAARLRPGQTVLIHAAAGGVGGYAVQLAIHRGAYVVGTASRAKHPYVLSLGAHEVVDYQAIDFRKAVRDLHPNGVDVAFDTVGGEVQMKTLDTVRRGGVLVSILAFADEQAITRRGVTPRYVFVSPNGKQLDELAELADAGKFRVHIANVFPLRDAAKAMKLLEQGHTEGKIVLKIA